MVTLEEKHLLVPTKVQMTLGKADLERERPWVSLFIHPHLILNQLWVTESIHRKKSLERDKTPCQGVCVSSE